MLKRITSCTMCLLLLIQGVQVSSEEVLGERGSFFALTYKTGYGLENVMKPPNLTEQLVLENGVVKAAQTIKTALDLMPVGRRCIDIVKLINNIILDGRRNYFFPGENVKKTKDFVSSIFKELKKIGAEIDYIIDDWEESFSLYAFENMAILHYREPTETVPETIAKNGHLYEEFIKKILLEFESDTTYQEDLKPRLEDAGFVFGPNYDLEYINIFPNAQEPRKTKFYESNPPEGAENCHYIFNETLTENITNLYNEAVYEPIKELYPNVKFGNYGEVTLTSEYPVYAGNGLIRWMSKSDIEIIMGTHTSPVVYGGYYPAMRNKDRVPPGYPYEEFKATSFNVLLLCQMFLQNNLIVSARHGIPTMPWVGAKSWETFTEGGSTHNFMGTDYYEELIFHMGLYDPDPFLIFDTGGRENADMQLFSKILHQLDEVVGFPDRTPIVPTIQTATKLDQRYILTGMKAGGRSVWRITPDLFTPGVSMETFLKSESPLTFQIGNQFIEFPEGSYIYEPTEKMSQYGHWVFAPAGSLPKEYRDLNLPEPDEPVETSDHLPSGYKLEAKGTGKRAPGTTVATTDNTQNTQQPTITEVPKSVLEVKPISFDGQKIALVTTPLPNDISGHWAEDTFSNLFAIGVIRGTDAGIEPDKSLNLAEFLTMLMNAFSVNKESYNGVLAGLNKEAWYADVAFTALTGEWITEEDFALLESNLTREKTALVFYNACKSLLKNTSNQVTFSDEYRISQSSREAVLALSAQGIISGYPDGEFKPKETLTRAHGATMIEAFFVNSRR